MLQKKRDYFGVNNRICYRIFDVDVRRKLIAIKIVYFWNKHFLPAIKTSEKHTQISHNIMIFLVFYMKIRTDSILIPFKFIIRRFSNLATSKYEYFDAWHHQILVIDCNETWTGIESVVSAHFRRMHFFAPEMPNTPCSLSGDRMYDTFYVN